MPETQTIPTKPVNPLLERLRIPGETFRLPSQGLFYTNGELHEDIRNGEVEVYPMTAMEEIIVSTPDKLLSGKAITEVISRCIPSILQPNQLLSKDVDFLMACLRMVSFGPIMVVSHKHNCKEAKDHNYNIKLADIIKHAKSIDPTTMSKEFQLAMPNGQVVSLTPLVYEAIMKLYQMTAMMKIEELSEEDSRTLIVGTLTNVIKSVDGVTDKASIEDWVVHIPLGWKKTIEEAAQKNNEWGINFEIEQSCQDCEKIIKLEVTANPVSFFT